MSKTRFALNTYTLLELKSQLALKLFFVVSNKSDCQKLSEILLKEGFGSISVTTLYRLFINYNGAGNYSFVDKSTLNKTQNYFYKVAVKDSCGNNRITSNPVKTMLLNIKEDDDNLFVKHLSWINCFGCLRLWLFTLRCLRLWLFTPLAVYG